MKRKPFYSFSYPHEGSVLRKRYVRGEVADGVVIDGFKTAIGEFIKYAKSMGVE